MQADKKQKLQNVLNRAVLKKELTGGILLVRKEGKEECFLTSGYADVAKQIPIRRDHIFRLYSMSKPITGAAVMKLMEDGLIDLGEAVGEYIPAFRQIKVEEEGRIVPAKRELTIKDLLDMTSGLLYGDEESLSGKHAIQVFEETGDRLFSDNPVTTMEFAEKMAAGPLAFQPGKCWRYGTSADVLGAVVEAASGMRFGEYLKTAFFDPLGMEDTGFFVPESKRDRLAEVSEISPEGELILFTGNHLGILNAMDRQPAFESGGAGLVSTVDDYAKFAQMLLNGGEYNGKRIMQEETVRFMTSGSLSESQKQNLENDFYNLRGFNYGNMVRVLEKQGRGVAMGHVGEYGWDGWLGCYFVNDPVSASTMLLMMQRTNAGMTPLAKKLRNVMVSGE